MKRKTKTAAKSPRSTPGEFSSKDPQRVRVLKLRLTTQELTQLRMAAAVVDEPMWITATKAALEKAQQILRDHAVSA